MVAIKAQFDGEKIIVPDELRGTPATEVILVFESLPEGLVESGPWMRAQEQALAAVWDNAEDAVYDSL